MKWLIYVLSMEEQPEILTVNAEKNSGFMFIM